MNEQSAGGVILRNNKVVIVAQRARTFSFPKGHINNREDPLQAAYREIYEESGLAQKDLIFIRKLETYTRPAGGTGKPKDLHMFLFTTDKEELMPTDKDNPEAKWVDIKETHKHLTYKEDVEFFLRHMKEYKILNKH